MRKGICIQGISIPRFFYVIPMQANILDVSEHLLKRSGRARAPGSRRLGFDSRSILSFLLLQYKNLLNRVPQGGASKRVMRTAMIKMYAYLMSQTGSIGSYWVKELKYFQMYPDMSFEKGSLPEALIKAHLKFNRD